MYDMKKGTLTAAVILSLTVRLGFVGLAGVAKKKGELMMPDIDTESSEARKESAQT